MLSRICRVCWCPICNGGPHWKGDLLIGVLTVVVCSLIVVLS